MKNRVKLIVALLASVLVVCGMFTMTTFAEEPTPAHVHVWDTNNQTADGTELGFRCTNTCPEFPNWIWVKVTPQDKVYDGEAYDAELIGDPVVFKNNNKSGKTPEMTFGTPQYSSDLGLALPKAPADKGTYKVTVPLKVGDEVLGKVTGTFSIKEFTVEVADCWYGETVSPVAKIGDSSEFDRKTYMVAFEYLSLDKRNAKYDAKKPKDAGHYRAKAYLYKYVGEDLEEVTTATDDFTIKKTSKTDNDNFRLVFLKDIKGLAKIDPEAIDFSSPEELNKTIEGLASKDIVTEIGEYGMPVVVIPVIGDNHIVYSFKKFGPLTVKYSKAGSDESKLFVPGVTLLPVGNYDFTVIIGGSKNNDRIVLKKTNVNIRQADPKWLVKPTAKKGLVFNDTYQKLINPGTAVGAKVVLYALEPAEGKDPAWSKVVPTAKDPGTYKVLFQVIPKNSNYTENTKGSIDVTIAETPAVEEEEEEEVSILAPAKVTQLKVIRKGRTRATIRFRRTKNDYFDEIKYEYVIKDAKGNVVDKGNITQDITKYIYQKVEGLDGHTTYKVKVRAIGTINPEEGTEEEPVELKGAWSKTVKFRTK